MALSPETGVHDVATLLKEFFRDLPEPIFPKDMQAALLTIHSKSVCKKCFISPMFQVYKGNVCAGWPNFRTFL